MEEKMEDQGVKDTPQKESIWKSYQEINPNEICGLDKIIAKYAKFPKIINPIIDSEEFKKMNCNELLDSILSRTIAFQRNLKKCFKCLRIGHVAKECTQTKNIHGGSLIPNKKRKYGSPQRRNEKRNEKKKKNN